MIRRGSSTDIRPKEGRGAARFSGSGLHFGAYVDLGFVGRVRPSYTGARHLAPRKLQLPPAEAESPHGHGSKALVLSGWDGKEHL